MQRGESAQRGSEAFTVSEDLRISFTRQLYKLRDDTVTEVTFPTTLTNIERKFLHKLAEELGLKSQSKGKGEDRCITVTKPVSNADQTLDEAPAGAALLKLSGKSVHLLNQQFGNRPAESSTTTSSSATSSTNLLLSTGSKASSIEEDANIIREAYNKAQKARLQKPGYSKMQAMRANLPAFHHKDAVCSLIKENQVVLISGETGCGKTTQVPQFLLDDPSIGPTCRIAVTQPRRISAMSVSERIAKEREEQIGGTIGYNIRMESEMNRTTQVLFVTPGVLLRKLQNDPLLEEFSHIIIDEAHERDRHTEFLIIILRDVCSKRKNLKLILMSATMHTNKLSSYFGGVQHISMGGSVFPVQEYFLEHVLRFTDYLTISGMSKSKLISTNASGAYTQCQVYFCPMCEAGAFKSPEELGTHVAMCSPSAPKGTTAGGSSGLNKKIQSAKGYSNIKDLVNLLTSAASAAEEAKAARAAAAAAAAARTMDIADRRASKNGGSQTSKRQTDATKATQKKNGAATASTESADVEGDLDGEDDNISDDDDSDDADSEEDSDDEDAHVPKVDSIAAESTTQAVEDLSGEGLLRQYHLSFDDSQVDYDLIVELLRFIFRSEFGKEGSVLVFLPGWDDISRMYRMLSTSIDFGNSKVYKLFQLHSGISKREQSAVFEPISPGEHKIILSTNIAETSVTIDDVAAVIDSGRMKEKTYDPHVKLDYLKPSWVSQASARQRKGRAGRTRSGVCFHLFSKRRHKSLPEFQDSELLRMPLEELVLQTKQLGFAPGSGEASDSVQAFLLKALDPPHVLSISNAVQLLQSIGCLDQAERLTPLGEAVSKLPVDPRIGRIIILGCLMGCGPSLLTTATVMGYRDPFVMPANEQQRAACNKIKLNLTQGLPSDQIALLKAMEGFNNNLKRFNVGRAYQYCDEHFLSRSTMNYLSDLLGQLQMTVKDVGLNVTRAYAQRHNGNLQLLMALIGIGLMPDIGVRQNGASLFRTEKGRKAKLHPSSVNSKSNYKNVCKEEMEIIGYLDLVSNTSNNNNVGGANLSMLNCTPVSVFALLLTCGNIREVTINADNNDPTSSLEASLYTYIEADGWLRFKAPRNIMQLVTCARSTLVAAVTTFITDPDNFSTTQLAKDIEVIAQVLTDEQPVGMPVSATQAQTQGDAKVPSSGGSGGKFSKPK